MNVNTQQVLNRLDNHENRITDLEKSDIEIKKDIQHLIEKLDNLTTWIKALVMLGATSLVGFFFWYIQNI